jgi:hypothetical protein
MAMEAGSVEVLDDETHKGNGLALALYEADAGTLELPEVPSVGETGRPYRVERPATQADVEQVRAGRLRALREVARRANAYAGAMVGYVRDHAEVIVTEQRLGRVPAPAEPGKMIDPPPRPVSLRVT